MPKSLFDSAMEREFMELYVVIFAGRSAGKTLTANEKHTLIAERMNATQAPNTPDIVFVSVDKHKQKHNDPVSQQTELVYFDIQLKLSQLKFFKCRSFTCTGHSSGIHVQCDCDSRDYAAAFRRLVCLFSFILLHQKHRQNLPSHWAYCHSSRKMMKVVI